jgi:DnaJ domain
MIYLVIGVGILVVVLLGARAFVAADPVKLGRFVTWFLGAVAVLGAGVALVLLLLSERLAPALIIAGTLAPIGFRLWRQWRAQTASGPRQGGSTVETAMLSMKLDHATGDMTGTVKQGPNAGRRLDELNEGELIDLLRRCRVADSDAARLLEAWLDRAMPDWRRRTGAGPGPGASADAMSRDEAYEILGLKPGAKEADIRVAHRRLMMKLHPDQGGSNYLAAKLNRAKEILLGD